MKKIAKIHLPPLHNKQQEIDNSEARRKVINFGRRAGKTFFFSHVSVRAASTGLAVLYAAPTQKQTAAFWSVCKKWLRPAIAGGLVKKNEVNRTLTFLKSGGTIEAQTAHNADTLRGSGQDVLILDEYAYMKPDAWEKVGAPMLLDNDGWALFGSTPNITRNHFYTMTLKARSNEDGRWAYFTCTSHDNPFLSEEALAEIVGDMTDDDYRREVMAEFIPGEGQLFITDENTFWIPDVDKHKNCSKTMTIDWGSRHDATSISIGCNKHKKELALVLYRSMDYPDQLDRIKKLNKTWKPTVIYAESNAMGLPNIQQLQADGLHVEPFNTTAQSKREIIQGLKLAIENHEWQFVDDETGRLELEAYEMKISKMTGQPSYGAPSGMHDDTIISRAILVWAGSYNPFPFAVA